MLAVALLIVLASATVTRPPPVEDGEGPVIDAVNAVRRERGLSPLMTDAALSDIARRHSCDMAERGFFEHTAPDGASMVERLKQAAIRYRAAAENLARIEGRDPAARAVAGWLKSRGHRENMLSPRFTTTGVGACRKGRAVYITQLFIRPP